MSGSRPLTEREEKRLLRQIRRGNARTRALVSARMFLGFRISEILALTIGQVLRDGKISDLVVMPPRFLKGHYGSTRVVPIGQELRRALENYFQSRSRPPSLHPNEPLFPSTHLVGVRRFNHSGLARLLLEKRP